MAAVSSLIAAAVGATAVASAYSANKQAKAQERAASEAAAQAADAAKKQEAQADQQFNRANSRRPSVSAAMRTNADAAQAGNTMLTGAMGVDPATLQIGKNTLLGS